MVFLVAIGHCEELSYAGVFSYLSRALQFLVVRGEPCWVETVAETRVRCVAGLAVLSEMWSPASLVLAAVVEVWPR